MWLFEAGAALRLAFIGSMLSRNAAEGHSPSPARFLLPGPLSFDYGSARETKQCPTRRIFPKRLTIYGMAEVCIIPLPGGRVRIDLGSSSTEVDLPSLCTNDDHRLLRWYFEDYAEDDPFQTSKAQEARELVLTYGRKLSRSLALPHLNTEHQPVLVKIIHGQGEDIFWESLEDPTLWSSSGQPSTVTVTRCVISEPSGIDGVGGMNHTEVKTTNILVVIARPQMDRDIPHRFVSSTIVKVADLTEGGARVEIVRPGTFAAFEAHLGSKPNGFFDVVHFDMHGEATPTTYEHLTSYLQK